MSADTGRRFDATGTTDPTGGTADNGTAGAAFAGGDGAVELFAGISFFALDVGTAKTLAVASGGFALAAFADFAESGAFAIVFAGVAAGTTGAVTAGFLFAGLSLLAFSVTAQTLGGAS